MPPALSYGGARGRAAARVAEEAHYNAPSSLSGESGAAAVLLSHPENAAEEITGERERRSEGERKREREREREHV